MLRVSNRRSDLIKGNIIELMKAKIIWFIIKALREQRCARNESVLVTISLSNLLMFVRTEKLWKFSNHLFPDIFVFKDE